MMPRMRCCLLALTMMLGVAACASHGAGIQASDPALREYLDRRLGKFEAVNWRIGPVIAHLQVEAHRLRHDDFGPARIVIEEEGPGRGSDSLLTIRSTGTTVRQVVKEALAQDGRLTAHEENGFLVLAPSKLYRDPKNPLNFVVAEVSAKNASPDAILGPISRQLEAAGLRPLAPFDTGLLGGLEEDITLKTEGKTLRWILIELAKQRCVELNIIITDKFVAVLARSEFLPRRKINYFENFEKGLEGKQ